MINVLKTAPEKHPISLEDAKRQLNIELGWTEDDDYINDLIVVATEKAEQFTRRRLITQTWYTYLDEWPSEDHIILPFGQLQSVTSVKYTDSSNTEITTFTDTSTTTTNDYDVDTNSDPGKIVLEYGDTWPTVTLWPMNPIQIEFVCGYGDNATDVPAMIKQAMKLIIGDLHKIRETEIEGISVQKLKTVESLLTPYKLWIP